jgi:hypothetical protein
VNGYWLRPMTKRVKEKKEEREKEKKRVEKRKGE